MTNLYTNRQKICKRATQLGGFTVEFAIVGAFLSLLLVFCGDITIKLAYKGKLDRLSYSLVNVLKERTQLYGEEYFLTTNQVTSIVNIATDSLRRTANAFDPARLGYLIESVTFDQDQVPTYEAFPQVLDGTVKTCQTNRTLDTMTHLSKVTTWGRRTTLYRVTLCYETNNWLGDLLNREFKTVQSDAVMIGR